MSKSKKLDARKIKLEKKSVRKLNDADLANAAGGAKPTENAACELTAVGCNCPSHNLCCQNHNQGLRRR